MGEKASCGTDPCSVKRKTEKKYDEQWKSQGEEAAAKRRRDLSMVTDPLLSMAHPFAGKVVVDLGIGTGCLAFRTLELSPPKLMVGVDFSSAGLCVARGISRNDRFRQMDCELVRGDLEVLPLKSRSADVVISQASINLLPNKCAALKEIARIVRPGGKIAISDAFRTSKPSEDESWEQCVAGAVTVREFTDMASREGLMVAGQVDLTQQVRMLVSSRRWDWPEFVQHNMDYRGFLLLKS